MSNEEFQAAWDQLSEAQRKAASWNEGSLLVLAGPGSGKTRVLTCRIARILTSSDENFRILGLTFTNRAADEMRSRVEIYTSGHEERLFLGTFHSFCADILRQHGTHLGISPNFNIYSQDNDLQEILNDVVEEARKTIEQVNDQHKKTLPVIHRLKSLLIQPEECQDKFRDPQFGKIMAFIYSAYEAQLAKRNALDFDSLIIGVYQLFHKFPALAKRYRMVYPYICIDEFQDTNQAQYSLLRALCGEEHRNLFIVADDDQIIYQWNGASHQRINEFLTDYSSAIIQLPTNYRCPQEIVGLANNLICHNFLRQPNKQPLQAFRTELTKGTVRLLPCFTDFDSELAAVSKDIKTRHSDHLGAVAMLGRTRKLIEAAQRALHMEGLAAVISQRKDEFESVPLLWVHSILRLANDKQNGKYLEAVCGAFAQIAQVEVDPEVIITQTQASNVSYLHQWVKYVRQMALSNLTQEAVNQVAQLLGGGMSFRSFCGFAFDWFDKLVHPQQKEGVDPNIEIFQGYEEERRVWQELMGDITRSLGEDMTLEAFLQELQMRSKEPALRPNSVVLTTIHGAKGKEFDHVYLIGLAEDEMPSFQSIQRGGDSPEMEEERRNCFVAITRAKETLTLSYSSIYWGWQKRPSRFLNEMGLLADGKIVPHS